MKVVRDLLEEILKDDYWCPSCTKFVEYADIRYSYGRAYHMVCGTDTQKSYILDEHQNMLEEALRYCKDD
jgi:hypothetical protein